jgi:hypothetical protein
MINNMENKQLSLLLEKFGSFVNKSELIKMTIHNKRDKSSSLKSIIITIVKIKKRDRLNFVYRHESKDIAKNYEFTEGLEIIRKALEDDFYNADIFANTENLSLVILPKGKVQLKTHEPTLPPVTTFDHDRFKERYIIPAGNIYLRELGVTNANGEVRREMSDKYKQINRYIELLEPDLNEIPLTDDYHIADMGSGKGYLTFALYDYMINHLKKQVIMTGVESRRELVQSCNAIAAQAKFAGLSFVQGTIEKVKLERIDILIALHACDTATDEAIYRGIKSHASLIVVAPCCHKQIRKAFNVANELSHVIKYGILKERQAEIVTDSLRALIMEAFGYKTKVIEFIPTEHTPKNVMITGKKVRETNPGKQQIFNNIDAIRQMFGIKKHYLEILLDI